MLVRPTVQRLFNCASWIVVLGGLCISTQNIPNSSKSANISRLLSGDQFPNPECPLQPQEISGCGPLDIMRGCHQSLPSNFCTRSRGNCASETCCFCRCPSSLPTFVSQSDGLKQCVSDQDLPNYVSHVRYPVCRYRVVAGGGLFPCSNGRNATIPVLDVTAPGNTTLTICSSHKETIGIHRARSALNVTGVLHGISSCNAVPVEIKYLVDGSWHNLSRIHFDKFTVSAGSYSLGLRLKTYYKLTWNRALEAQFSGLIFSVKTKCMVLEQDRIIKSTHVCLLFKSAGTYRNVKPTVSQLPRSRLIQINRNSKTQQARNTLLTQPAPFNPTKPTVNPLNETGAPQPTEEKSMGKAKLGESNSVVMIIVISCGFAVICIILVCGFVLLTRRNKRNAKGKDQEGMVQGSPFYDVLDQRPQTHVVAENTYEALQDCTRSSRGPHIYQSLVRLGRGSSRRKFLNGGVNDNPGADPAHGKSGSFKRIGEAAVAMNTLEAMDENGYLEPVDGHCHDNGSLVKNQHRDKTLPHLSSISDREVSGYIEPEDDDYPTTDFKEDGLVPVNAKRLPGYYEPACIILGQPPQIPVTERPNSVEILTSHGHKTPKYHVLERPDEEQAHEVVNMEKL